MKGHTFFQGDKITKSSVKPLDQFEPNLSLAKSIPG